MAMVVQSTDKIWMEVKLTQRLLEELAGRKHPAAAMLLEAWLVDMVLQGDVSVAEAAALGEVTETRCSSFYLGRMV
jgi:hypothetical protein